MNFAFFLNAAALGLGLAMDAFSVSLANGLGEPKMKTPKMLGVAGMFAFFQALMPLIGWVCVHTIAQYFEAFEKCVPWIALLLLVFIGGKMIYENVGKKCEQEGGCSAVCFTALIVQGIATSIDALSVGFTIAEYKAIEALVAAIVIAVVTFIVCYAGVLIGKKVGTKFSGTAQIFGGVILILIGIEIFITGLIK